MPFLLQPGLAYRPAPGVNASAHRRQLQMYLWLKSGGLCGLCAKPIGPSDVHADHIVPRARGGNDGVDNLQAAHQSCNSRKKDRNNDEAVAWIRRGAVYPPQQRRAIKAAPPVDPPIPLPYIKGLNRFVMAKEAALTMGVTPMAAVAELHEAGVPILKLLRSSGPRSYRIERADFERFLESRRGE